MGLRDQAVVVTGASRGIGRAIVARCVAEGARVLATDHGDQAAVLTQLAAEADGAVVTHGDDLADPAAAERIVAAAVDAFGAIDGVVNNAALVTRSDLAATDAATFDRILAVNTRAPLLLVRAALPLRERRGGRVVNIGSINAWCGQGDLLAYSLSKGALMTLTRNLGDALAPRGVRVNQLNPGWVFTETEDEIQRSLGRPADWHRRLSPREAPAGRMTQPADVAAAVAFWLSAESFPASGTVVDLEQYPVLGRNPVAKELT